MKEGWKIKKLGEICDSINGLWKGKKGPFVTVGVLRSTNFTKDCRLNLTNVIYLEVEEKTFEKRKLREGDIIVERSGGGPNQPVGRAVLFKEITGNFSFCNFTSVLRIKETTQLIPKYLHKYLAYFYLSGGTTEMQSYTIGLRNLDYNRYLQIDIPIPSKKEQLRIIEILDAEFAKIDALRANAMKSLQAAKDLFQSALKQELQPKEKWKSYKLQDVCTEYGTYGMSLPSKVYDGIRYLRITDITEWGELNNEKVSADTKNIDDKYLLHDGDILFARTGATVGKTLVYNNTMGKCSYAGYLIRYRPNQEIILPQVLYYITHSKFYYNWVMTTQKSTTLPNISAKLYNRYEFSIPISLAEQTRIVSRLDQLNERCKALQENYDRTISLCEDLKQALLRKAFNGEL